MRKRKPQLTRAAAFILAAGAGGSCRSAIRSRAMQLRPLPSQEAMQLRPHLEEREGRDRKRGRGRRRKSEVRRVAAALESGEDWGFGSREMKTCLVGEGHMGCLMGWASSFLTPFFFFFFPSFFFIIYCSKLLFKVFPTFLRRHLASRFSHLSVRQ